MLLFSPSGLFNAKQLGFWCEHKEMALGRFLQHRHIFPAVVTSRVRASSLFVRVDIWELWHLAEWTPVQNLRNSYFCVSPQQSPLKRDIWPYLALVKVKRCSKCMLLPPYSCLHRIDLAVMAEGILEQGNICQIPPPWVQLLWNVCIFSKKVHSTARKVILL